MANRINYFPQWICQSGWFPIGYKGMCENRVTIQHGVRVGRQSETGGDKTSERGHTIHHQSEHHKKALRTTNSTLFGE